MFNQLWIYFHDVLIGDGSYLEDFAFNVLGYEDLDLSGWLSYTLAMISMIVIFILCCLFIGKIVKTVAHLFDRL